MEKNGNGILRKKSERRSGSTYIKVSRQNNKEALERNIQKLNALLRFTYPPELAAVLAEDLDYFTPWYENQIKDELLIRTRSRLIVPNVIEGGRNGKYFSF